MVRGASEVSDLEKKIEEAKYMLLERKMDKIRCYMCQIIKSGT